MLRHLVLLHNYINHQSTKAHNVKCFDKISYLMNKIIFCLKIVFLLHITASSCRPAARQTLQATCDLCLQLTHLIYQFTHLTRHLLLQIFHLHLQICLSEVNACHRGMFHRPDQRYLWSRLLRYSCPKHVFLLVIQFHIFIQKHYH